ncbi:di-heme oxidoredictase family protein [Loktanella sp. SALINAS62]|uniref:di-heme oxidoreductase family protein n=1 Tax=Loktanella sp. SALINAS62 TaxID=2706124 RepID=UPI001B8BBC23|nr:di-heme oxidoredictase family protein [Loktanella sp. SALINAS62]MBS1302709.1 c-type cytochrome [Loktanella sp. SALINAS62]
MVLTPFLAVGVVSANQSAPDLEPHLEHVPWTAAEADRAARALAPPDRFDAPRPFAAKSGGAGTVRRMTNVQAFSQPQDNLSFAQGADFAVGNGLFERLWVSAPASTIASDGLGPLYNARSCQDCHIKDGRGHAPTGPDDDASSLVVRLGRAMPSDADLSALESYLGFAPDPVYGAQFSDLSLAGIPAEGRVRMDWETVEDVTLAGGETVSLRKPVLTLDGLAYGPLHPDTRLSPRVAPQMIGLGLIEAIRAEDILARADPDDTDADGISGRAHMVWSPEYDQPMLGRFGVRATTPTLRQQAADAFHSDIGIASPLRPDAWGDCTETQTACRAAPDGMDAAQDGFEIAADALDLVTFYSATLAVPERRNPADPQVLRGQAVFHDAQCAACHTPAYVTHRLPDRPQHAFQLIWPYSDFLLHDMGDGLADDLPAGDATGSEWRTPPLWGLGLVQTVSPEAGFLHDGRARTLTEAILWHGGEAASARANFVDLSPDDRAALTAFLESL